MPNTTIDIDVNDDELFDCVSMYAIAHLDFNFLNSYQENQILSRAIKEEIRPIVLGIDGLKINCHLIPLKTADDVVSLSRVYKSFNLNNIYLISFMEPSFTYTLVNYNFETEKEMIVGRIDAKKYTRNPISVMWLRGTDNFNYYNVELMG